VEVVKMNENKYTSVGIEKVVLKEFRSKYPGLTINKAIKGYIKNVSTKSYINSLYGTVDEV